MLAVFSGKSRIWLILCSVTMAVFTSEALKGVAHLFLDLMVKSSDLLTSVPPLPEASLSLKYLFPLHVVCLPSLRSLHTSHRRGYCEVSTLLK